MDILTIVTQLESRKAENRKFQKVIRENREAIADLNSALLNRLIEMDDTQVVHEGKVYSRSYVVPSKQLTREELADSLEEILRECIQDQDLVDSITQKFEGLRVAKVPRNRVERLIVKRSRRGERQSRKKEVDKE